MEPPFALPPEEAREFIKSFPRWYHRIYLGNGVYTLDGRGFHEEVWRHFEPALPDSLAGRSVLDVGTNAGYFALQARLRSAEPVVGIDFEEFPLAQAETIRKIWGVDIEYRKLDAEHVLELGRAFDIVVFAGILYHLKNPLKVIEDIGKICTDAILLETEVIPDDPRNSVTVRQGAPAELQSCARGIMKFMEKNELNGDFSNWWVPDTECVMGMLRTAGFTCFSRPLMLTESRLCLLATKARRSALDLDSFGV